MLIIALGSIASGSTWAFNVARLLLKNARSNTHSLSSAEAIELLNNIPSGPGDVLVKAHWIDQPFVSLASLSHARIIITTRDPRDSFVSHRERFGAALQEAVRDLSRTSATLGMLPLTARTLWLKYEDGFTDDPETVARIASFLDLNLDGAILRSIYDELRPERVARAIDRAVARGSMEEHGFDDSTHWHLSHVGDGGCGKWRHRLQPDDQEAVIGALGTDFSTGETSPTIFWSPKLFTYYDERAGTSEEWLSCNGEEQPLIWGPYLHLVAGRWQIRPLVRLEDEDQPVTIRVDTFIPVPGRDVLALRAVSLPVTSPDRLTMEFDHHDHMDPIELRISSIGDRRIGSLRFSGVELTRLGPSERRQRIIARPIN